MSDDEMSVAFTLDYQISADDYAELVEVERSASRWRPISNALTAVILISACVGTFLTVRDFSKLGSCVNAEPAPSYAPVRVWIWQCNTAATPGGVVGDEAGLFAADTLLWYIGISGALGSWLRRPQRQARRLMRRPGVPGRHLDQIAEDGVSATGPTGIIVYIPWSAVTGMRETDQRFFLLGPGTRISSVLPKRGLLDPASIPRLADYLRARTTPPPGA